MSKKQKIILIRICFSALLCGAVWLSPLEGMWRMAAFLVPYAIIGFDVVLEALRNILHGQIFDEKFLMTIATAGALAVGKYPEAVAVMLFYQTGELFQSIAVGRSRKSIALLMDIRPDYAVVLRDEVEVTVDPSQVSPGEIMLVKPGEKIALDGEIVEGTTSLNTSALTGESMPVDKTVGDKVVSGVVNLTGVIKVRAESPYERSTVAKILELVESASEKKAKSERFITVFSRYYTPCIVGAAALLALAPPLFFAQGWDEWISRALIFLVVSCPCALVVSVPLSFFGGIGGASRSGILIKGANYLEALSKIDTIVFDKTGTLTKGNFAVEAIHPESISEAELLDIAAAAESYSIHPVAESIIAAHNGHIDKTRIGSVTELSGQGLEAIIDNQAFYVGNSTLMDKVGATWHECHLAGTIIHVSKESEYLGHIVISDELKTDAADAIQSLKALGISKTVMLTGDTLKVAASVGKAVGVDEVRASLLPHQKVSAVEELMEQKHKLAFVGDGINDAPVLARADVGIAMGALGSDAAIESADIVLMDDKPKKISSAIIISRRTMRIARQNIWFALAVKGIILALGALGIADMWIAVFGDVGVTVIAVLNAMRAMARVE